MVLFIVCILASYDLFTDYTCDVYFFLLPMVNMIKLKKMNKISFKELFEVTYK